MADQFDPNFLVRSREERHTKSSRANMTNVRTA